MAEPLTGLEVVDLLGVFYEENTRLMVADEFDGSREVYQALASLIGHEVRLLAHHRPREPHDLKRWGGGCCLLENVGYCHFGHHDNPHTLYSFNAVGTLGIDGGRIFLQSEEGSNECAVDVLVGHRSQIVVTSIPDMENIDEKVKSFDPSNIDNPTIENLSERLSQIRDYLLELDKLKNNLDG